MYETSNNQSNNTFVQANLQYETNSQGTWGFTLDSISLGSQRQNTFSPLHQMARSSKTINETSSFSFQTFFGSKSSPYQSQGEKAYWSKKACIQSRLWCIISNNS